ncbi:GAF domain-containing protein [Lacisediminihabitans profunda]|uniref:GAF domain-containing protein n=1 Tax=Lacisediminihabitans profunda TaxID=2594790 RepID=UPI001650A67C|nr:GAF domain-containing protein [Lacisediminihabitans profunda]
MLRRLVTAAVDAGGADSGALALFSPKGAVTNFVSVGRPEQVDTTGTLDSPLGIVDLVLDNPRPIRLSVPGNASGSVPELRTVESILGVPVAVGDEVLGCLYLCNHESGLFSDRDERILEEWALAAALAADHGRVLAEVRRRRDWTAISAEVASALVTSTDSEAMDLFTDRLLGLTGADFVALLQVSQVTGSLVVSAVRGLEEEDLDAAVLAVPGTRARGIFEGRHPILIDDCVEVGLSILREGALGPGMVIPLTAPSRAVSILLVARSSGAPPFGGTDLEMTADFAELATVALALATPHAAL